jgi:hypothetical protein
MAQEFEDVPNMESPYKAVRFNAYCKKLIK